MPGQLWRSRVATSLLLLAGGWVRVQGGPPEAASSGTESQVRFHQLVHQLGDGSYASREKATRELTRIGVPAKPFLLAALENEDAEVRYRARRILVTVLDLDLQSRIAAFTADLEGEADHDLPCWRRYQQIVGNSREARELFVEMVRTESGLLDAVAGDPATAGDVLESRCQQIQMSLNMPQHRLRPQVSLGSVAALLLVGSDEQINLSVQSGNHVSSLSYSTTVQQAMTGGGQSDALRKLLIQWIRRDLGANPSGAYQNLMLAMRYNIREGVEPAQAMLSTPSAAPHMRQWAILVLARFGGLEHVALVEPFLTDEAVLATQRVGSDQFQTQVRDVALVACVYLCGQKPQEFGFPRAMSHPTMLYITQSLGFASQDQRGEAQRRWREWFLAHGAELAPAGPEAATSAE